MLAGDIRLLLASPLIRSSTAVPPLLLCTNCGPDDVLAAVVLSTSLRRDLRSSLLGILLRRPLIPKPPKTLNPHPKTEVRP